MGGGGLLIFYVTNVACYKCELRVSYIAGVDACVPGQSAFWIILVRRLDYFNTAFPAQKLYLCTEFQSALKQRKQRKLRKQRIRIQENS